MTRSVLEQLLAAQSGSLDRARLAGPAPAAGVPDPLLDAGSVPYVVTWPPVPPDTTPVRRTVPDVRGLTLRAAARRVHQNGLEVKVKGWGTVQATDPAAGTIVNPGAAVVLTAGDLPARGPAAAPTPRRRPVPIPSRRTGRGR